MRTVGSQERPAEKLSIKSAPNLSQQVRRLDRKAALKKVPEALDHLLTKLVDSQT